MTTTTTLVEGGHAFQNTLMGGVMDESFGADPHTGPRCARCEEQFCSWCDTFEIEKGLCPEAGNELPGLEF